jgi:hypothetical protein
MIINKLTLSIAAVAAALASNREHGQPIGAAVRPIEADSPTTIGYFPHPDWQGEPLQAVVRKGLAFLVEAQGRDGGYGQDGSNPREGMGTESQGHDVANTAMVALALLRSGTSPTDGTHTDALLSAVNFILGHIEMAPEEGLGITDLRGTQIQRKLGPYVDTFLSSMLLAELQGRMPDDQGEARVKAALEKCVAKIEKHQQADGSWNQGGWAPVISTSLASRSLDAARQRGIDVDEEVMGRADDYAVNQFDKKTGKFNVGEGDAGVSLYKVAQVLEQASRTEESREANKSMVEKAGDLLASSGFQAGFGSMGGEEFISYMNLSDSLARTGGEQWVTWNKNIGAKLTTLQNQDGSWAGHHCITGRVACTSAAIMTLLTERTIAKDAVAKD